jgi:hypothetical protein
MGYIYSLVNTNPMYDKAELNHQIEQLRHILPKDAKFVNCDEIPNHSAFKSYRVTFEHPVFTDKTEIQLTFFREVTNLCQQFTVLTGIKYIDPDKGELYK